MRGVLESLEAQRAKRPLLCGPGHKTVEHKLNTSSMNEGEGWSRWVRQKERNNIQGRVKLNTLVWEVRTVLITGILVSAGREASLEAWRPHALLTHQVWGGGERCDCSNPKVTWQSVTSSHEPAWAEGQRHWPLHLGHEPTEEKQKKSEIKPWQPYIYQGRDRKGSDFWKRMGMIHHTWAHEELFKGLIRREMHVRTLTHTHALMHTSASR